MTAPFKIESKDISSLNENQLTLLLQILLYLEAGANGLVKRSVDVALNIKVGDGGEDGRISWDGAPTNTDFFPRSLILFQNKATDMDKAEYAKEIVSKETRRRKVKTLKPMVEEVLDAGGAYITFTTQELNTIQKQERINAVRDTLSKFGKSYAYTCFIDIYDASKISGWVNQYVPAITSVNGWIRRPMLSGLKTFELWSQSSEISHFKYCAVDSRQKIIDALRDGLSNTKAAFRVTGLSGIGKTRTVYEVFNNQTSLMSQVVYFDAAQSSEIRGLAADWISLGIGAILVVDNCDLELHQSLVREVLRDTSKISLLTLDYNIEQVGHPTKSFQLTPLTDQEILQFLKPVYQHQISDLDLDRIAQFAQGFPQMAVLLAIARLADDPNIGKLNNDDLANKLLWNRNESRNPDYEKILQVCSLYDSFGVDGNLEDQLHFIASVAGVSVDTCFECIQKYTRRGIVDRRGRLGQITPKPLAILLASQWWELTRNEKQLELIETIPDGMIERFCEQIKKLDFSPKVKTLTENLCGKQGPFGQAEMILSVRGSLLFRAFVEVGPEATSKSLYVVLNSLTHDELLSIDGDIRRNLVWALERLCFRSQVFEESAWCLLLLASAENETWSNNATGTFKQLFKIWLSGTEAHPHQRFYVLEKAIGSKNSNLDAVVINALEEAISTVGGSRTIGAEKQGTKPSLEEWTPKLWQDVFDYWDNSFNLLFIIYERDDISKQKVISIIGEAIRPLFRYGRVEILDIAIKRIVQENGRYWPSALESIRNIIQYDLTEADPDKQKILSSWQDLLDSNKGGIVERIKGIVSDPPWEALRDPEGRHIDIAREKAENFAVEIAVQLEMIFPLLSILSSGDQKQAWPFGRKLIEVVSDYSELLRESIKAFTEAERPNASFLMGILNGIYIKSDMAWECVIGQFASNNRTKGLYPLFISTGKVSEKHLDIVVELAREGEVQCHQVSQLANGQVLQHLDEKVVLDFCRKISGIKAGFDWAAIDIVFMYQFSEPQKLQLVKDDVIEILTSVSLSKDGFSGARSDYQWKELVEKLLQNNDESLAIRITQQILADKDRGFDHGHLWHTIKPILNIIMRDYANSVWPMIASAIEVSQGIGFYWMQQLLDREDSFSNLHESLLNNIPVTTIIEWCKRNPEKGPVFVASCINIFDVADGDKKFSALFIAVLENFGGNVNVQSALSANLYTRGWVGSLVPYLEADKTAFSPLLNHENHLVRDWVKIQIADMNQRIAYESARDQERDLGVF